jgi:hypothetical protein
MFHAAADDVHPAAPVHLFPEVLMTRSFSILSLLAGILLVSVVGGCASTQPHGLAGREPPSTNINARYPTLPPM